MVALVNNVKTVLLMGAMTGLLVAVGGMIGRDYLLPFLLFGIVMNLGAWLLSDRIAIAAMRGQEVDETTGGELYQIVRELSARAGLPMPRVYVCPHDAPNAFATGRSPRHAAVAVTQGALRLLNRSELEGVIAHELAHIRNRDTLTSTVAATIAGVLAFLAQWGLLLGMGHRQGSNPIVVVFTVILAAVGAAIIKAAISRSREFVADADGAAIAGSPAGLMAALAKLDAAARRVPLLQPNPAQNNLFIVEPLCGNQVLQLFATHPPTEQRIAALRRLL